jgi:hypothetical protein
MLQLCATVLNQADERSVSSIDFLTSIIGMVLAWPLAREGGEGGLERVIPSDTRANIGFLLGATPFAAVRCNPESG